MLTTTRKPGAKKRAAHSTDVAIGARIRMRRIECRISQAKLGEALGVSFQQVQKYEKGVNRVSGGCMAAIAKHLDVAPSFFFEQDTDATGAAVEPSIMLRFLGTSTGMKLAKAFVAIDSPIARTALVDLAEALATPQEA